jgi:segregation and condensation protein B
MTDRTLIKPKTELSLEAKIEALLFVALGEVKLSQLAAILGKTERQIEKAVEEIEHKYKESGIRLQRHLGRIQFVSAPEASSEVELFLGLEVTTSLSQAALETIAIIAYQQPITRPMVDAIRGVNSDGVMRTLLSKGLIQEAGRAPGPGRPIIYNTTPDFLSYFGLTSLDQLPPLNLEVIPNGEEQGDTKILKE